MLYLREKNFIENSLKDLIEKSKEVRKVFLQANGNIIDNTIKYLNSSERE